MAKGKILVVDDEKLVRWSLVKKFTEWGYSPLEAETGGAALQSVRNESPELILLDIRLPDVSGMEILQQMKEAGEPSAVIMMTADPQLDDVKAAIKLGAYDFIGKPIDFDELSITVQNALEATQLRTEVASLRDEVKRRTGYRDVIAASRRMRELLDFVRKVAASEASTILIQGESGTGKDLVAKTIHYESSRAARPFVAINCSAIPETLMEPELFGHEKGAFTDAKAMKKGLFEVADGGTLFLDEIGELSPFLQAKLLRVLEDQNFRRVGGVKEIQVDVRVIAASNRDLERAVSENRFRQDLFYRLAIISVFLPSLRERKEDILPLVDFFVDHYNRKFRKSISGLTEETRQLLLAYDWPGNVRELKNAIERAMILEDEPFLRPTYLPFHVTQPRAGVTSFERQSSSTPVGSSWQPLHPARPFTTGVSAAADEHGRSGRWLPPLSIPEGGTSLEEVERALVELALKQTNGNQTHAAKLLDISRDALRYKMKKFGLIASAEEPTEEAPAPPHP